MGVVVAAVAGAFTWSLLEYLIHRWLGHKFRRNPFAVEHTRHHSEGNYFAATWKKAAVATLFAGLTIGPAIWLLGTVAGGAWVAGFVSFYVWYEVLHRRCHTHAPVNAYGAWARRNHFWHHYGDVRCNHGVTSPVWDHVFRTHQEPGRIRVPRKMVMPWLIDAGSGAVRSAFSDIYEVRGG